MRRTLLLATEVARSLKLGPLRAVNRANIRIFPIGRHIKRDLLDSF